MASSFPRLKARTAKLSYTEKFPAIDETLLQELLPDAALQLASSLSDEDKEDLVFLVVFSGDSSFVPKPSVSTGHSPWRPWRLSSKGGSRRDGCPACPFSAVFAASFLHPEDCPSRKGSSSLSVFKGGVVCNCFSVYSRVWGRWNASPKRDLINDILDLIEEVPQHIPPGGKSKKKKKKRLDRKRGTENEGEKKQNLVSKAICSNSSDPLPTRDKDCDTLEDEDQHVCDAIDKVPYVVGEKSTAGHKKSLFRGLKQKQKARHINLALPPASENTENESSLSDGTVGLLESAGAAVKIEITDNVTIETLMHGALNPSSVAFQAKINGKLQQQTHTAKRRSNQILPLDCDNTFDKPSEQEPFLVVQETNTPMSPRPPDVGLGGRGFLARVFPDTLGRVASRLWDLVSVRLHIRTVEYE